MRSALTLAAALALTACPAAAPAQLYFQLGAALHDPSWSRPEVRLANPLGHVEAGYTFRRRLLGGAVATYIRHESGITDDEAGYGLTEAGASWRYTWNH